MNKNIPCDMIQDLLPLYVDGLTRETTSWEIEKHMETCRECRESYERMRVRLKDEKIQKQQETCREIDYLKTLKKRNVKNVILGIGVAIFIILGAVGAKLFIIGSPCESYITTYINTDEDQIHIGGVFFDSASVYTRHKLVRQPDGSQKLVIYACLASVWNRNGAFNLTLDMKDVERQVQINGNMVTKEGFVISRLANELYGARNPYIGDASADGRLTKVLDLGQQMGSFKNELQTTEEPYGWTLRYENSVLNSAVFEARMKDYACVLLALTDNLGQVTWVYTVETETGAAQRQTTLTEEEAEEYLGVSVKAFGESPKKVQELLDLLNLP